MLRHSRVVVVCARTLRKKETDDYMYVMMWCMQVILVAMLLLRVCAQYPCTYRARAIEALYNATNGAHWCAKRYLRSILSGRGSTFM
jgi:hypothetical protein